MIWFEVDDSNEKLLCGAAPSHFIYNIIAMFFQDSSGAMTCMHGYTHSSHVLLHCCPVKGGLVFITSGSRTMTNNNK